MIKLMIQLFDFFYIKLPNRHKFYYNNTLFFIIFKCGGGWHGTCVCVLHCISSFYQLLWSAIYPRSYPFLGFPIVPSTLIDATSLASLQVVTSGQLCYSSPTLMMLSHHGYCCQISCQFKTDSNSNLK